MNVLRNIIWGLSETGWAAAACVLIAALATVVDGASLTAPGFRAFVAFYSGMALLAGVLLGVGRPLLGSVVGRGIVGFLVALPVLHLALFRPPSGDGVTRDSVGIAIWLALSAVFGPIGAAYVAIRNRQRAVNRARDA